MTRIGAFYVVWVLALFPCEPIHAREVPQEELKLIGQKIFANECSSRIDYLTCWNEGEAFASLGVGHFIWYPKGGKHPFEETLPRFIAFLKERGVPYPHWLDSPCPWHSRQEFYRAIHSPKMAELATFLNESIPHQIAYMQHRFERFIAKVDDAHVHLQVKRLQHTPGGYYPLIDYLNFKGEGLNPNERYHGLGWGLIQVLKEMKGLESGPEALTQFSQAASTILKRRVANADPTRHEERWLTGWLKRCETYARSSSDFCVNLDGLQH